MTNAYIQRRLLSETAAKLTLDKALETHWGNTVRVLTTGSST